MFGAETQTASSVESASVEHILNRVSKIRYEYGRVREIRSMNHCIKQPCF